MRDDVQLTAIAGSGSNLFGVIVDGRFVGRMQKTGESVVWKPWFSCGSIQMSFNEFLKSISRWQ